MVEAETREKTPLLRLYLEPAEPIEVGELTLALASLARQYHAYAKREGLAGSSGEDARLLVASVAPGSIEIHLAPLIAPGVAMLAVMIPHGEVIAKFVDVLDSIFKVFKGGEKPDAVSVTAKDCEDVINIAAPIAHHGGQQTFNVINGPAFIGNTLVMTGLEAKEILESAVRERTRLVSPDVDKRQRVSMIWTRLDRDKAKTDGKRSPDHGQIDEIDKKPHAVLFTDEMTYLKDEMIADEENPYQKVYFVDVEISRVGERITGYRVTGYHGKDDLE